MISRMYVASTSDCCYDVFCSYNHQLSQSDLTVTCLDHYNSQLVLIGSQNVRASRDPRDPQFLPPDAEVQKELMTVQSH